MGRLSILLFFILITFEVSKCQSVEEMLETVNDLLGVGARPQRHAQEFEETFSIWQEYEFGTGAGNREEVVITNISINEDPRLPNTDFNWVFLSNNGTNYLACAKESIFMLHISNANDFVTKSHFNEYKIDGQISTFALINEETTKLYGENNIIVILCVTKNGVSTLQWYRILGQSLNPFWAWPVHEAVKDIKFLRYDDQNKLFLLHNKDSYVGEQTLPINIYGFSLNFAENVYDFWLSESLPITFDIQICKVYGRVLLALRATDYVLLYNHVKQDHDHGKFEYSQTIKSNNLINFICFESGYMQYIAISGSESALFHFSDNEFQYSSNTEDFFNAFPEIAWVKDIRIETYRAESLLLVQLKNSTVFALAWQGEGFKKISLPNELLDGFDLSEITSIPGYGFVSGNKFVRIETKLRELPRPIDNKIARLIKTHALLEDVLHKQESVIDWIDAKIDFIDRINRTDEGSLNVSNIITTNLTIENAYYTISLGSNNLTYEDILTDISSIEKLSDSLQRKYEELNSDIGEAFDLNAANVNLTDIDISGNIIVKGNLYVDKFSANSINGLLMEDLLKYYVQSNGTSVINGKKSFPEVEATNWIIRSINGIPLEKMIFELSHVDYSNVNFSNIDNVVIDGNLTFSTINNVSWDHLVWKNKLAYIPGKTIVDGEVKANAAKVTNLNDLRYPHDYVVEEKSTVPIRIDGSKSFDRLIVDNLNVVGTINNISINEFVTLDDDHILDKEITFHDITVLGSLKITGNVTGFDRTHLIDEPLINETTAVSSDVIFLNLAVLGKVYLADSIDNKNWSDFDDILLRNDANVRIVGTKTFMGNVNIHSPFELTSNSINGHDVSEFVTLDTQQVFPNLREISADVTFNNVTFGFTQKLEDFLKANFAENSNCLDKAIIFKDTLTVDTISFDSINNISNDLFFDKLNQTFKNVHFNNLTVETLNAQEIVPEFINNVKFTDFVENVVTLSTFQHLNGYSTFDRIETNVLQVERINGLITEEWNDLIDRLYRSYQDIFNGNVMMDSVTIKGTISTPSINGVTLKKMYDIETMGNVIFQNDVNVNNLTILDSVNGFNLMEVIENAALKTDTEILVTGYKEFENISCEFLEIKSLNGHKLEDLLDAYKIQNITVPVTVNGTVNVLGTFDSTGKINNISFRDLIKKVKKLDDETFELNDNVQFINNVKITDFITNGTIDGTNFNEFTKSVVLKNEDNVILIEPTTFLGSVTFNNSIVIEEALNDINLKEFYKNAIFIDQPLEINSSVIFEKDIVIKNGLQIVQNLEVKTIGGVDIEDLMDRIVYVDRPTYIDNTITFTNITFDAGIRVDNWNDMDMSLLIPLQSDQIIRNNLIKASDIEVGYIDIQGKVNGYKLDTIYTDTLMRIGDQSITGTITFPGKVRMRRDFSPYLFNGVNPKQIILLNTNDTITGDFEFKKPITINGSLRILSKRLNDIDPVGWEAVAITTNFPVKQIVSGKWTIHGNVYLKSAVTGDGLLNGINSTALADMFNKNRLTLQAALTKSEKNQATLCKNAQYLQHYAQNQLYKFDSFEYLQSFGSFQRILSVHYFELNDLYFLLVSLDTCHVKVLQFIDTEFKVINTINDFGYVERWITLNHKHVLYFVAIGKQACKKSSTNLWKLENDEFVHIYDFYNSLDVKKLSNDRILVLFKDRFERIDIQQTDDKTSLEIKLYYVVNDQNLKFVPNTDRILLANRHSIYEYDKQLLNFTSSVKCIASSEIVGFKVGIFEREEFLHYDKNTSKDYIFVGDNNFMRKNILQTITTHNPASFSIINFEERVETLLIFVENNKSLQIYEYKGIQGFVHRDTIKMKAEKIFPFKIRKYSSMVKRHCLAVIQDNRLTILEAKMYGEKLDMPKLSCTMT